MPALSFEFIVVIGLCVVLGVVLRAYERLIREHKKILYERKEIEDKARQHAGKIIDEAKDKALAMLEEVSIEATEQRGEIGGKLEEVSDKQLDHYKNTIQSISKDIKEQALREMREFSSTLDQRITADYQEIQKDIDSYREQKINDIKLKLTQFIEDLIPELIGKRIKYDDQEKIILEALEEAKDKHVI